MKEFDELLAVAHRLNAPDGCPWDLEQTFFSLQPYVIEEAHEVVEAVDSKEDKKIIEELGDLLYTVIFYAKVAERDGRFSTADILNVVREKLIRRHPHVFGEVKVDDAEDVVHNWDKIKKEEAGHASRESALDGIPATLPALPKAQKIVKKIRRTDCPLFADHGKKGGTDTEQGLGEELIDLVVRAEQSGIDIESALRRVLADYEAKFRSWEKGNA